jgi:signal transduction histidine kinase
MMKAGTGSKNEILEAMAEVGNQAERAGQIINRIRKMVRKQHPQQSSIIIENIIDDAVLFFKSESQNLNITIEKVDPPDRIPGLFGDPIQIEQVLLNLLHNSIDALGDIDKSGKTIAIGISKVESDKVEILVSDNGKGISVENCDKMFDPFFTTKTQGIGVGLSISRSIIEAHGGKIWAESNPDRGLTVRFTLPLEGVRNE